MYLYNMKTVISYKYIHYRNVQTITYSHVVTLRDYSNNNNNKLFNLYSNERHYYQTCIQNINVLYSKSI